MFGYNCVLHGFSITLVRTKSSVRYCLTRFANVASPRTQKPVSLSYVWFSACIRRTAISGQHNEPSFRNAQWNVPFTFVYPSSPLPSTQRRHPPVFTPRKIESTQNIVCTLSFCPFYDTSHEKQIYFERCNTIIHLMSWLIDVPCTI